jgi:hypothetical protein
VPAVPIKDSKPVISQLRLLQSHFAHSNPKHVRLLSAAHSYCKAGLWGTCGSLPLRQCIKSYDGLVHPGNQVNACLHSALAALQQVRLLQAVLKPSYWMALTQAR